MCVCVGVCVCVYIYSLLNILQVKDDASKRTNDYEIIDFMVEKFKGLFGLGQSVPVSENVTVILHNHFKDYPSFIFNDNISDSIYI